MNSNVLNPGLRRRSARSGAVRRLKIEPMERRLMLAAEMNQEPSTEEVFWVDRHVEIPRGEWIVQFKKGGANSPSTLSTHSIGLSASEGDSIALARRWLMQRQPTRVLGQTDTVEQWLYTFDDVLIRSAMFDAFSKLSDVVSIEPNQFVETDLTPNDPSYPLLWGLNQAADHDIDAPEAWDLTTGSSGTVVGVIDTGVFYEHEDLAQNIWVNPVECPAGYGTCVEDGIDNDGNGYIDDIYGWDFYNNDNDPFDDHGHGTHVAGTIAAAGNNGIGVTGVNWNAKIMSLKFLSAGGRGTTSGAIQAVQYATMMKRDYGINVRLTNNSWGGGGYSQSLYDAITASGNEGMLFVAAAGNDSEDTDSLPHYPSTYDHDNVISVAATTSSGSLATFSNYGSQSVDLGAPGQQIYSTIPSNQYGYKSGTSMATPHVAGVAALAWSADPAASYPKVRDAILDGVQPNAALQGITVTGGDLNALRAVQRMGFFASAVSPSEGQIVDQAPTTFTFDFSANVDATSLAAGDLMVNAVAADNANLVDPDTVEFTFSVSPVMTEGTQTISINQGAILSSPGGDSVASLDLEFLYDPTPLRVTSMSPVEGSTVDLSNIEVEFDFSEPLAPGSVTHGDLLLSDGLVNGVTLVDSDTVRFQIGGIRDESTLTITLPPGSVTDSDGFGNEIFVGTLVLDLTSKSITDEFFDVAPLGSRTKRNETAGLWSATTDIDQFTLDIQGDKRLSVMLNSQTSSPTGQVLGRVRVLDPNDIEMVSVDQVSTDPVIINSLATTIEGTYTVSVENIGDGTGSYSLESWINSSLETETSSENDTQSGAQSIDGSWLSSVVGVTQATVAGAFDSGGEDDWYSLSVDQEIPVSLRLNAGDDPDATLTLHASGGTELISGIETGGMIVVDNWFPGQSDTIGVKINGDGADYVLTIVRGASFDGDSVSSDSNSSISTATDIQQVRQVVGHLGAAELSGPGIGQSLVSTNEQNEVWSTAQIIEHDGATRFIWPGAIDPRLLVRPAEATSQLITLGADPEGDQIRDIVYTPDGLRYLMAHPETGNVLVYEAATGNVVADLDVSGRPVDLEITPNGQFALSANTDGNSISVIDLTTLTVAANVPTSAGWPFRVHATSDSNTAVAATADEKYVVISLNTLTELHSFDAPGIGTTGGYGSHWHSGRYTLEYTDFAISPDGTTLISPGENGSSETVELYDLQTGNVVASHPVPLRTPSVVIKADGSKAYAVSRDFETSSVVTIDVASGAVDTTFTGPKLFADHLLLTQDEQHLLAGGFNALSFIPVDGSPSNDVSMGSTDSFALSYDGQYVLGRQVVDVATQSIVGSLPVFSYMDLVATSPTELKGIQASQWFTEDYSMIDLANPSVAENRFAGAANEGDSPIDVEIMQDGITAVTANYDSRNLTIVDLQSGQPIDWIDVGYRIDSFAMTPDGSYAVVAASGEDDHPVVIVNLQTRSVEATLTGISSRPRDVAVMPDGSKAFAVTTGANDPTDSLYFIDIDGASSAVSNSIQIGNAANGLFDYTEITLSPDGSTLAVPVTRDSVIAFFDTATETEIASVNTGGAFPTAPVFSPDGNRAYVRNNIGDSISAIQIDGANTSVLKVIAQIESPRAMALDENGDYLYVASVDGVLRSVVVIDTHTLDIVQTIDLDFAEVPKDMLIADGVLYVAMDVVSQNREIPFVDDVGKLLRLTADGPGARLIDAISLEGRTRKMAYSSALEMPAVLLYDDDALQLIDTSDIAFGDEDYYRILPEVGDEVVISTVYPDFGVALPANELQLSLQAFGPDHQLIASSGTDSLTFTTSAIGPHFVRLYAQGLTSGEYALTISGVTIPDGPALIDFHPIDGAFDVGLDTTLVLNFDQPVFVGSGNFLIRRSNDDSVFETVDVASASVVIDQSTVYVTPQTAWELGTDYYIEIDAGAFVDGQGDPYLGVNDKTLWNFSTGYGFDFGDAPVPYPVSQADGGARHSLFNPRLGVLRDSEFDGVNTVDADGDDITLNDDEDGVVFSSMRIGETGVTMTVTVQGIETTAFVDAWIDFDQDGFWGASYEQVAHSFSVNEGTNQIEFDVPSWATVGETFARVRLSSEGGLGPKGNAPNGEVEDYAVQITGPASTPGYFTDRIFATDDRRGDDIIIPVDFDKDGDLDAVVSGWDNARLGWLENDGSGNFTGHIIYQEFLPRAIDVVDMDGDGHLDVVAASYYYDRLAWYRNDGNQNFQQFLIDDTLDQPLTLSVIDFDSDGDWDIALNDYGTRELYLYTNDGSDAFSRTTIASDLRSFNFSLSDIDSDGDLDFLTSVGGTNWHENTGSGFTQHSIDTRTTYAIQAVDFDRDGDMDIVSGEYSGVALFLNDGNQTFAKQVLPTQTSADALEIADVDGDGDSDVIAVARIGSDTILSWIQNDGGGAFSVHPLTDVSADANAIAAADFDGDTDLDIMAATSFLGYVWFQNLNGVPPQSIDYSPTPQIGMIDPATDLTMTFDQPITEGQGDISIYRVDDDSLVEAISMGGGQTSIANDTLTVNPSVVLDENTAYYIQVDPLVVVGSTGEPYQGWTSKHWVFTTVTTGTDYGDAPDQASGTGPGNYNTTAADNGASHQLIPGLYLGFFADPDSGTLQNPKATADDADGTRIDEDGLLNSPTERMLTIGSAPRIRVNATNTTGADATLSGWLDYDRDGEFENHELATITVSTGVEHGVLELQFPTVPAFALGEVVLRLRIGPDIATIGPTGSSTGGEVEDHLLQVWRPSLQVGNQTAVIGNQIGGGPALSQDDQFGEAIVSVGDIDGDGVDDLAIGAPYDDLLYPNGGAVYIALMNTDGTAKSTTKIYPDSTSFYFNDNDYFGTDLAPAGDIDFDGVNDLIVLAKNSGGSSWGTFSYLLLNSDGTLKEHRFKRFDLNFYNQYALMEAIAPVGDLNRDGLEDFAVGGGHIRLENNTYPGAVFIAFSGQDGFWESGAMISDNIGGGPDLDQNANFGESIAAIGDIDGDGVTDLAVGDPYHSEIESFSGAIYILLMNVDGTVKAHHLIDGSNPNEPVLPARAEFGTSVAAIGDRNGDGITEILVGAEEYPVDGDSRVGAAFVLSLDATGAVQSSTMIGRESGGIGNLAANTRFGRGVGLAGDINQDGVLDLAIGARPFFGTGDVHVLMVDPGQPPTDIVVSNMTVDENSDTSAPLLLATLTAVDPSVDDTHAFELVSGSGDDDNGRYMIDGDQLKIRQGEFLDFETDPQHSIRIKVTDSGGMSFEKVVPIDILDLPEVESTLVGDGSAARSKVSTIDLQFDGELLSTDFSAAVTVTDLADQSVVVPLSVVGETVAGKTVIHIDFDGSLADGHYLLTLDESLIRFNDGSTMAEPYQFGDQPSDGFFRLLGDSNGDGRVDRADLVAVGSSLQSTDADPEYNWQFDFDENGAIDAYDFALIRSRLSRRL